MQQGYTVYPTQGGAWSWFISPKNAILPREPSNGKAPNKEGAETAAKSYLQRVTLVKAGVSISLATPKPHESAPKAQNLSQPATPKTDQPTEINAASTPPPKLYVVDAHTYIYRAFHAVPITSAADGTPVNALGGFLRILLKFLKNQKPERLAVVFEAGKKSFRHDLHPEYKAGRETPPELVPQIPLIKKAVAAMGIRCIEVPGYEGDDIMGTLAVKYPGDVVLVAKDKDLMQVVSERVTLFDIKDEVTVGVKEVKERFGVTPDRVVDILALAGDTTDSIPGVPGIGDKTAAKFISEFGSLDELLKRSGEVKGKVGEKLVQFADQARLSRKLATLVTDMTIDMKSFELCPPSVTDLHEILETYVPDELIKQLDKSGKNSIPTQAGPDSSVISEFRKQYYFLSNFANSEISYAGKVFPTAEHLFQALKTTDPDIREQIRLEETPGKAKYRGRSVLLRSDWEAIKLDVMREVLRRKFSEPTLKSKLLATGSTQLVEGNTWNDTYWGVCNGTGENQLGKLLMELREHLSSGTC